MEGISGGLHQSCASQLFGRPVRGWREQAGGALWQAATGRHDERQSSPESLRGVSHARLEHHRHLDRPLAPVGVGVVISEGLTFWRGGWRRGIGRERLAGRPLGSQWGSISGGFAISLAGEEPGVLGPGPKGQKGQQGETGERVANHSRDPGWSKRWWAARAPMWSMLCQGEGARKRD